MARFRGSAAMAEASPFNLTVQYTRLFTRLWALHALSLAKGVREIYGKMDNKPAGGVAVFWTFGHLAEALVYLRMGQMLDFFPI